MDYKNRYAHWWEKAEKDFVGKKINSIIIQRSHICVVGHKPTHSICPSFSTIFIFQPPRIPALMNKGLVVCW